MNNKTAWIFFALLSALIFLVTLGYRALSLPDDSVFPRQWAGDYVMVSSDTSGRWRLSIRQEVTPSLKPNSAWIFELTSRFVTQRLLRITPAKGRRWAGSQLNTFKNPITIPHPKGDSLLQWEGSSIVGAPQRYTLIRQPSGDIRFIMEEMLDNEWKSATTYFKSLLGN